MYNQAEINKMLQYKIDKESLDILGHELRNKPSKLCLKEDAYILDLGGNTGKLIKPLDNGKNTLISIDIDRSILVGENGVPLDGVTPVQGDILYLPFSDNSFDFIFARAILHHVPDNLDLSFKEIKRILKPGGLLLIEEPGYHNPVAYIVRNAFPTTSHEEDETPLKIKQLIQMSKRYFNIKEIKYFWLVSYSLPHLIVRLPNCLKAFGRKVLKLLVNVDKILLRHDICKLYCGYVMILCQNDIR